MNSILVEVWYVFKVSSGNIIRDCFVKTKLLLLSPPNFTTNTQACVVSVQVSYVSKAEDTNVIAHRTIGPIEVQEIRTDDPMVVLQAKWIQQSFRSLVLLATVRNTVRQKTIIPLQEIKKNRWNS